MIQQIIWTYELADRLESCHYHTDYLCHRAVALWGEGAEHTVCQLIEEQMVGFLSDPKRLWITIPSYANWGGQFWEGDGGWESDKPSSEYRREFLQRLRDQPNRRVVLPLVGERKEEGPAL